jgi:hypothetical protein
LVVALAAGLGIGLVAAVPTLAAEDASAEQIAQLIEQLGSANFGERELASKKLDAIGLPALEALRKAAQGRDAEVRRRAEELVQKIEKRGENARLLEPKRVHLVYKDTPVAEAVADFASKSGYNITLLDPLKKLGERKVTLDTGETSFWEAFDQFCAKAGLVEATAKDLTQPPRPNPTPRPLPVQPAPPVKQLPAQPAQPPAAPPAPPRGGNDGAQAEAVAVQVVQGAAPAAVPAVQVIQGQAGQAQPGQAQADPAIAPAGRVAAPVARSNQIVLVDGKPAALPTCYSGAVRVQALSAARNPRAAESFLVLQVSPEPKLQWQSLVKVQVDRAVNDQGKEMQVAAEANPAADPNTPVANVAALVARPPVGYGAGLHQQVPIRLKKDGDAKMLKQLEGTITAQVWGDARALITVDDVLKAAGKTVKGKDGGSLKVIDASRAANGTIKVCVEMETPPGVQPAGGGVGGGVPGGPVQILPIQIQPAPAPAPPPAPNGLQFQQAQPAVQVQAQIQIAPAPGIPAPIPGTLGLALVDDKGQRVQPTGFQQQVLRAANGVSVQYTLTFPPLKADAPKLVFSASRSATLEIPFKLKDVPLP